MHCNLHDRFPVSDALSLVTFENSSPDWAARDSTQLHFLPHRLYNGSRERIR